MEGIFLNNINKEILEIYSDIINNKKDIKNSSLKSILGSFSKKYHKKSDDNKKLSNFIVNEINYNGKFNLIEISKRIKILLYHNIIPQEIKNKNIRDVLLSEKILSFSDISDIKLDCVKVLLSNIIQNILRFFIIKTIEGEIEINKLFVKFDSRKINDSLGCYIDMYYGIEYLIITEVLTKLLSLYFMSKTLEKGGSRMIVERTTVDNLNKLYELISRNDVRYRNDFKNIFIRISNSITDEFQGGSKSIHDIINKIKNKTISKEELLQDPELCGAINVSLGEIKIPKLEPYNVDKEKFVTKSGNDILNVVFGNKASENIQKIFNDKYNMSANDIVNNLENYKDNINNSSPVKNNSNNNQNFENSFNFTEKDIDILYTLNLIDALKSIGTGITPLSELYELDKNQLDKNITVNFYTPVSKATIDGTPIEKE